jgi:hypothetical protein
MQSCKKSEITSPDNPEAIQISFDDIKVINKGEYLQFETPEDFSNWIGKVAGSNEAIM